MSVLALLTLGACSSNDLREEGGAWDPTPPARTASGPTCLPPTCGYPDQQPRKTATSAKPTVKPKH